MRIKLKLKMKILKLKEHLIMKNLFYSVMKIKIINLHMNTKEMYKLNVKEMN